MSSGMSVTLPWAWDAYAMSHLSAEACTQRLAAGRSDGYQATGYQLAAATAGSVACSHRTAEHWTTGLASKPLVDIVMSCMRVCRK